MKKTSKPARSRIRCRAESRDTGLVHDFDVQGIADLAETYAESHAARLKVDLAKNSAFWRRLQGGISPAPTFLEWTKPVYRLVYGDYDPLSILGSITFGGRFNVGGSQYIHDQKLFPGLVAQGCIYGATTLDCAYAEAGDLVGCPDQYEIIPKYSMKLWRLADVINHLDIPGLLAEVNAVPTAGVWAAQRSPLQSQLLATYLRSIGGDGLIFPSTKQPDEMVVTFFLKDEEASKKALTARPVNSTEQRDES